MYMFIHIYTYIYIYRCVYIYIYICLYLNIRHWKILSICNGSHSIKVLNKKSFILHVIY